MTNAQNEKQEGQTIPCPSLKEIVREKLRRSEAGEEVYLDPDEVEIAENCFGYEPLRGEMSLQDVLDARWTPEELDEAVKNASDEYADKIIPAEVANEMLLTVMGTIQAEVYKHRDTNKEEADRLRTLCSEVKKRKDKIRTYNPDYSNQIIAEWKPVLKAKDEEKSLWEKINSLLPQPKISEEEREKRRKAIANAVASFELEGISQSEAAKAWDQKFINGELSREAWLKGSKDEDKL